MRASWMSSPSDDHYHGCRQGPVIGDTRRRGRRHVSLSLTTLSSSRTLSKSGLTSPVVQWAVSEKEMSSNSLGPVKGDDGVFHV